MIDNQAIETMSEMLSLIKKYAKNAYPEVETEASDENRQRAWVLTSKLAEFAAVAAESDMHSVMSELLNRTYSERDQHGLSAKEANRDLMLKLHEFKMLAEEYKNKPVAGKTRTDADVVRELEVLRRLRDERGAERLGDENSQKLETAENLASKRGLVVSFTRHRTVITRTASHSVPVKSASKPKKSRSVRS